MSAQSQTPVQALQRYAKPLQISPTKNDIGAPFSYQDWVSVHQGIIPGQEYLQYNEYLVNWFRSKELVNTDENAQLRLRYLLLLRQLQLFFTQEETENWYNKVDLNNDKELLLAIPYFAKKLKEIALYYIQLRKNIKEARLKYNQVGSGISVLEQLQKIVLSIYSQKSNNNTAIPYQIWKNVPALSSLKDSFNIELEELYDSQNYFDLSPNMAVSAYFDTTSSELENFLTTRGLQLTSSNWIYKLGILPLTGEDLFDYSLDINRKYLGQNKFTTEFAATTSTDQDLFTIEVDTGNNFFLWPGTPFTTKAELLPRYIPVPLNSLTELSTLGAAGSSIENSDTIFVKTEKGIEGAWLSLQLFDSVTSAMTAIIEPLTKVAFRYPFAGYGLSGDGTAWTGFDLKTTQQYFYLDQSLKDAISEQYWSASTGLTSVPDLKINNSTLVYNGAYPSSIYKLADKVRNIQQQVPYSSTNIQGNLQEAWLYKFTETDISIGANQNNTILWPYKKINIDGDFPNNLPDNLSDVCLPVPVSGIDMSFATAGTSITNTDVIYKLTNYQDTSNQAIECCWLSGQNKQYPNNHLITVQQPSFQGLFKSGTFTPFVWTGPEDTDIEQVFKTVAHQRDCKYVTTPNTTYLDFNLCTCKQVLFTPFGHPGTQFTDYSSFADYIYEVNGVPETPNIQIARSSKFAWYQTNSKIGWGTGRWVSNRRANNNKFYLKPGKMYYYYRAGVQTSNKDDIVLPDLVAKYSYNNFTGNNFAWIQAYKNNNNEWVSTNARSNMSFAPGDILLYQRANTQTSFITSTVPLTSFVTENRGSLWTNYDYLAIGTPPNSFEQQFILSLPPTLAVYPGNTRPAQIPGYLNSIIEVTRWTITDPLNNVTYVDDTPVVSVIPTLIGQYSFAVTVLTGDNNGNTGYLTFTAIPNVTAISPFTTEVSITGYDTTIPGFVLKTPLQGWNYTTNRIDSTSGRNRGGKPFWAKTYTDKTSATDFKGVYYAGNITQVLDDHNIISQPEFSDIVLKTGQYVEYDRQSFSQLKWVQPLTLNTFVNRKRWNTILFEPSATSNLSTLLTKSIYDLVTIPTNSSSNIVLQNYVNNKPVEIYYNAISPFTWNIAVTAEGSTVRYSSMSAYESFSAISPWTNFSNLHYPTIAVYPSIANLYSAKKTGGYFTPTYLGASVYVDSNYTVNVVNSSSALGQFFEDSTRTIKSRGLSQTDPLTPYTATYNSVWLKEPLFVGPIGGSINKKVFKKYQKLIPYQSSYETNPNIRLGIILPNSRQSPWTGPEDQTWGDLLNNPTSPTGELNIEQWKNTQVLKNQNKLQLDCWVTDIFGNQYGLYKNYKNVRPSQRTDIPGQIWVRNNAQLVSPASISLSGVFDTYLNSNLYNQLTGDGIFRIDIFYDTLLIETANALIFEKLEYDYNTDTIFSITDNARFILLDRSPSTNIKNIYGLGTSSTTRNPECRAGETWFFPESKQVYISISETSNVIDNSLKPTTHWEFKNVTSNILVLDGTVPLPSAEDALIVSVGGVLQPHTSYTINPLARTLTFINSLPSSVDVFVMLPYNPNYLDRYDSLPKQFIVSSVTPTTTFLLPQGENLSEDVSQYVVTIRGVTQHPKGIPDNPYSIIVDNNPRIIFSEPIPANTEIIITKLPRYILCSSSEFYSWVNTFPIPQTNVSLATGPTDIPSQNEAYLVNVGGVLQAPSSYIIDKPNRQMIFLEPIPPNVSVCITQLSVPQFTLVIPNLYLLDLNTQNIKRVFPNKQSQITAFNSLSSYDIIKFDRPVLSYNESIKQFLYTTPTYTCKDELLVVETVINNLPVLELNNITVYASSQTTAVNQPPIIPQDLYEELIVLNNIAPTLDITCPVENGSAKFVPVNMPTWVKLSSSGRFTGTAPIPPPLFNENIHYATFYAYNDYGRIYGSLTIRVIKPDGFIQVQETPNYLIDNDGGRFAIIE